jgi:hypothetical protein
MVAENPNEHIICDFSINDDRISENHRIFGDLILLSGSTALPAALPVVVIVFQWTTKRVVSVRAMSFHAPIHVDAVLTRHK